MFISLPIFKKKTRNEKKYKNCESISVFFRVIYILYIEMISYVIPKKKYIYIQWWKCILKKKLSHQGSVPLKLSPRSQGAFRYKPLTPHLNQRNLPHSFVFCDKKKLNFFPSQTYKTVNHLFFLFRNEKKKLELIPAKIFFVHGSKKKKNRQALNNFCEKRKLGNERIFSLYSRR